MADFKDKGTFKFAATYEVNAATALDPRVQWDSFEDLIKKDFWPTSGDTIYVYNGIIASVGEEVWMLVDKAKFVNCVLNSVGLLNSLAKIVKNENGTSEIVYDTKYVATQLGWKVIGSDSEVDNHCLNI